MNRLPTLAAVCLAAASAVAQGPSGPTIDSQQLVQRIPHTVAVPSTESIDEMIVGRFFEQMPGSSAIFTVGGEARMCYQPSQFRHFFSTGLTGVTGMATAPSAETVLTSDRFVYSDAAGLHVASWPTDSFVDLAPALTMLPWRSATSLRVTEATYGATTLLLIVGQTASNTVSIATFDGTTLSHFDSSSSAGDVLDSAWIDWDGNGTPELAVVTTTLFAVLSSNLQGPALFLQPTSLLDGHLATSSDDPQSIHLLAKSGSNIWSSSHITNATSSPAVTLNGLVTLPTAVDATGFAVADLNVDSFPDWVVSATDGIRRVLYGTSSTGPSPTPTSALDIKDDPDATTVPATLNFASAQLADMDGDGRLDLTVASNIGETIIVMPQIDAAAQTIATDTAAAYVEEPAIEVTMSLGGIYDLDDETGWENDPTESMTTDPARTRLLLRLDIPNTNAASHLMVSSWRLDDPTAPGGSSIDSAPVANYLMELDVDDDLTDVFVPIDHTHFTEINRSDPYEVWLGSQRYYFELRLVKSDGTVTKSASAPSWMAFTAPSQVVADLDVGSAALTTYLTNDEHTTQAYAVSKPLNPVSYDPAALAHLALPHDPPENVTDTKIPQNTPTNRWFGIRIPFPPKSIKPIAPSQRPVTTSSKTRPPARPTPPA